VRRVVAGAAVLVAAILASMGGLGLARREYARTARARREARGERALRIVDDTGASLSLHAAGGALEQARRIELGAGETWLPEGRYFVEAKAGVAAQLFPVELRPPAPGPEPDGSWSVVVRRPALEPPPRLEARVPGFVFVPAGWFTIGERENPGQPHEVWVPAFHLAAFEVTNGEFRRFLEDPEGYESRASWTARGWAWKSATRSDVSARLGPAHPRYARFGRDELPVTLASWHEASAFCRWLTRTLGSQRWLYRMPTEAEWEKAARGPDGFDYGLGMRLSEPTAALYNWRKNPGAATTLVGVAETLERYRPNRYGLFHASGNAREWTQSIFRHYNAAHPYREDDRNQDEADGLRVTRGGSWYSASAVRLQLAYREELQPELASDDLGFRVAAVLGAGGGAAVSASR
jgi:formylglycine-generating enzyme required for sulfatase activity